MKGAGINKKSYKRVIWWVISCLLLLAALQTWSLVSIYRERNAEFDKAVISAMNRAAYEEVTTFASANKKSLATIENKTVIESSEIPKSLKPNSIQAITIKKSSVNDSVNLTKIYIDTKIGTKKDSARHSTKQTFKTTFVSYGGNKLVYNLHRYDSLLQIHLLANNISLPSKVDIVKKNIDSHNLKQISKRKSGAVQEISFSHDSTIIDNKSDSSVVLHNPRTYSISVYNGHGLYFRVRIDNPNRVLFKELRWIILTTLLILLLVAFIFVYLLRTIFRQKTLEKMRIDFTHNITHELKTPISVAYAANDALENFGAADDEKKRAKYLEIIREQLKSLSGMVERILSASRDEVGGLHLTKEKIDLYDFLQDVVEPYRSENVQLDVSVEPDNLLLVADRFHLEHVFDNLIGNSIKYSSNDANSPLSGCGSAKTIEIKIAAYREEKIIIKFTDNGMGIPAAALPHIFEKYYRVTNGNLYTAKGFGLGLYYVKMVVEAHGGTISVTSKVGKGTSFVILLPL
jgi:signal transduction histidine kinase